LISDDRFNYHLFDESTKSIAAKSDTLWQEDQKSVPSEKIQIHLPGKFLRNGPISDDISL
jgi:hypothetical protein